jgi:hypothetical protein
MSAGPVLHRRFGGRGRGRRRMGGGAGRRREGDGRWGRALPFSACVWRRPGGLARPLLPTPGPSDLSCCSLCESARPPRGGAHLAGAGSDPPYTQHCCPAPGAVTSYRALCLRLSGGVRGPRHTRSRAGAEHEKMPPVMSGLAGGNQRGRARTVRRPPPSTHAPGPCALRSPR